eukprot:10870432-Heterocapsa_arctica.AAC.1
MYSGEDPHEEDDGTWWDDDAHDGEEPPTEEEMDIILATFYQGQMAKKRLMGSKKVKCKGKGVPVKKTGQCRGCQAYGHWSGDP